MNFNQTYTNDALWYTDERFQFWGQKVTIQGQGRLSLSTDGDKCAMVNFGGNEKSILGGMKKFNIKSVDFVHKFNN